MKLTVLVDNNTFIGDTYQGEPGLSFYIEEEDKRILFDTGYSDVFIKNAYKMNINLNDINTIVLSHGHLDHTWGLAHFMQNVKPSVYKDRGISIITHPETLCPKADEDEPIGFIYSEKVIKEAFNLQLSQAPVWISKRLVYLGQIKRTNDFENKRPIGKVITEDSTEDDYIIDDSALAYKSDKGLVIITGCSHSGICNIIEAAKDICGEDKVLDIIGGFHLLNPSKEQMDFTIEYLSRLNPDALHACHCTDLKSKIELSKAANLTEVGVGLTLEYD